MDPRSPRKTSCRARVQITVEVDAGSAWGSDASADQIFNTAREESVARVLQKLEGACNIVGTPVVTIIWVQEKPT